ncbi:hypothetical protein THARTR1_06381 [Trichoderma harzianum]|uniref:Peptidase metallopeptidase domain-containing protein n=1 Tax=Trichoderma harzianum TaxID=5544 RepID=A0A2K0U5Y7_TRIHA|nr:hypothetical protein THARTR1_06381 [Trichoderma harzianum]
MPNTFSSAKEFVSHNLTKHINTISEDQITVLQDTCRKIVPPNISQCPLCPWPQDEKEIPDAVANLEHVGNCIHEFSLNALPWAESLIIDATDPSNSASREKVEEWLKSTEEKESADIRKINIKTFVFFPTQPLPIKQEWAYIPEEYFAESSNESSEVEPGSLSLDSDLPEVRGTCSDDISNKASEGAGIDDHDLPIEETPKFESTTQRDGWDGIIPRWRLGSKVTYVICTETFPALLSNIIQDAMIAAIGMWQAGSVVRFEQVGRNDPATFAVTYKDGDMMTYATSFFPGDSCGELAVYQRSLEQPDYLPNILAHEIGHILGFRHEYALVQESLHPSVLIGDENAEHLGQTQVQKRAIEELRSFYESDKTEYNGMPVRVIDPEVRAFS